jgi:hypothetical protein
MGTPTSVAVGASLPGEQFAVAIAAIFKAADDIFLVMNSPTMLALRRSADIQAILQDDDADLKKAQTTSDITIIDKESSG